MKNLKLTRAILLLIILATAGLESCRKTEAQQLEVWVDENKPTTSFDTTMAFKASINVPYFNLEESIDDCHVYMLEGQDSCGETIFIGNTIRFCGERVTLMACRLYNGDITQVFGEIDNHHFCISGDSMNFCGGPVGLQFDLFIARL